VFLRRAARLLAYHVAEVVGRQVQPLRHIGHGGRADGAGLVVGVIVIEDFLEAREQVLVRLRAGPELAVVETLAVVQQQLYGRGDDQARVPVGGGSPSRSL